MKRSTLSERALVLAPRGRDAAIAAAVLREAGLAAEPCGSVLDVVRQLDLGAAFVIVTEEALVTADLEPLAAWLKGQEEWSDLPFVLLTSGGGGLERNPAAKRYLDVLGNVSFLERPFHPTTLVSLARSALRSRRRQYEARARLAALAESETRFRNMADHAPVMTWVTDPSGSCTYLSRSWYEFTGQTRDQAEGFSWLEAVHPDDRGWSGQIFLDANARREAFRLEYRLRRHDGTYRWALDAAAPRFGANGEYLGYVGSVIDIDERREVEEALRGSEERLRLATENAEIGFWDVDVVNDVLIWPPRVKGMFGISPDVPVTMQDFYEGLHPDDRDAASAAFAAACDPEQRALYDVEYRTVGKEDALPRFVAAKGRGVFDEDGRCVRVIGTAIDVTKRKRTQIALRESEARYRTLFDAIESGFCVAEVDLDAPGHQIDYRVVEANPAFYRQTGLPGLILGRWLREAAPDLEEHWYETYGRVARTGEPERFEQGSDMLGRWFDVYAFRVGDPEDRRVAILFDDISARRNAEVRLRELNETLERRVEDALAERKLLADIVEGTDAFVQVVDLDFRWMAINKAAADEFERIYGVRPSVRQSMLEILSGQPEHQEAIRAVWARALTGEEFTEIAEFGEPGRARRFYEMKFNALLDAAGRRIGAYQFVYDVTQRVEEQRRLGEAEEALRQAQKMEAVGQLTGGVAHDFNNLLTIIKSSTDLLRRPGITEERRSRYVEAISDTVDRASRLTGQLLAFARRQALKPEVFNVAERVQSVTEMLGTIVGSRVRIVSDVSSDACFVMADASQFETALVNMAVNARDAMDGEGILTVSVQRAAHKPAIRNHAAADGDFVSVSLADTGSGIPADKIGQIFEPFFTTKEVGKGTGLGLSQVFGFAKQSGGDVSVESDVGRGSMFTLYLPRVEGGAAHVGATSEPAEANGEDIGRGRRVLVVEDNIEVGRFSTQLLQDLGYETTLATNGVEALKLLVEASSFDVVFSDVVMPGMSGVELGHEIRRRNPKLPVVLTSGYSHVLAEEGRHGFELLKKPYAIEDLSRMLRRVTRARRERYPGG